MCPENTDYVEPITTPNNPIADAQVPGVQQFSQQTTQPPIQPNPQPASPIDPVQPTQTPAPNLAQPTQSPATTAPTQPAVPVQAAQPNQQFPATPSIDVSKQEDVESTLASAQQNYSHVKQTMSVNNPVFGLLYRVATCEIKFRSLLIYFVFSLVIVALPSYKAIKVIRPMVSNLDQTITEVVDEVIPSKLEVSITDGEVSTNVEEPYFITVSNATYEKVFNFNQSDDLPTTQIRLLAIDTSANAEEFDRYQSQALLTKNSLVSYDDGSLKIQSIRHVPDVTYSKQMIEEQIDVINKDNRIGKTLHVTMYSLPLLMALGRFFVFLIELLLFTLLVLIIDKILQTKIGFVGSFKLVGAVYLLPAIMMWLFNFVPNISLPYYLVSVATDLIVLAVVYVFLKNYQLVTSSS